MGRGDTRPTLAERRAAGPRDRLWSDFSYVASSSYRERVLRSLAERPKLPKQLAQDTDLRLVHVSRALRELRDRSLVECLTPEMKSRGRLYGILPSGSALVAFFRTSTHRYLPYTHGHPAIGFVPKIRGTLAVRCLAFLRATKGDAATRAALKDWSVTLDEVTESAWLPVDAYDEFFELLEASFGDGDYDFIREMSSYAVPSMSAVKEQILKAILWPVLGLKKKRILKIVTELHSSINHIQVLVAVTVRFKEQWCHFLRKPVALKSRFGP